MKNHKKGIIVVCQNGLGHFRRSIRVAQALCNKFECLTLNIFCHPSQIKKTVNWDSLINLMISKRITFTIFTNNPSWETDLTSFKKENLLNWHQNLPIKEFQEADFVISDNLPGVLHLNPNTVLMGSFLWSEILSIAFPESTLISQFHDEETELLKKYKPYMICHKDFAMPYVLNYCQPVEISWIIEDIEETKIKSSIKNILITGGGTQYADSIIKCIIRQILKHGKYQIFSSKHLVNDIVSFKKNIQVFDFTSASFHNIDLMIGRPGIGATTDAVAYCIPFLAIGENDNQELKHNADRLEWLGFGLNLYDKEKDICTIIERLNNSKEYSKMQESLSKAPKTGLDETIEFLTSHFRLKAYE